MVCPSGFSTRKVHQGTHLPGSQSPPPQARLPRAGACVPTSLDLDPDPEGPAGAPRGADTRAALCQVTPCGPSREPAAGDTGSAPQWLQPCLGPRARPGTERKRECPQRGGCQQGPREGKVPTGFGTRLTFLAPLGAHTRPKPCRYINTDPVSACRPPRVLPAPAPSARARVCPLEPQVRVCVCVPASWVPRIRLWYRQSASPWCHTSFGLVK